jgi:hypothetical protein
VTEIEALRAFETEVRRVLDYVYAQINAPGFDRARETWAFNALRMGVAVACDELTQARKAAGELPGLDTGGTR